jgi:LCP family protein required for cell wall assembly
MECNVKKVKNQLSVNNNQLKQQKVPSQAESLQRWRSVGIIATLLGLSGGALALTMKATPFHQGHARSHQPNRPDRLSSLVPATLDRSINVLVLGIDNSGHPHSATNFSKAQALSGNSDTMLLVRLVPATHQINILSIPRDTLVQLPGVGIDKINDANMRGGAELAEKTVNHLLNNIPIDHYIRIDTESLTQVVDALGGVEVNVPKPMNYVDKTQHLYIHFQPGPQVLNGQHLQEYVRFREDALGDIGRIQRQQEVLKALLHKLWQPATLGRMPQLLRVVHDNIDTDLSVGEMLGMAQFLASLSRQQSNQVMLPGRFSTKQEYPVSYWIESPRAAATILGRYFGASPQGVNAITGSTANFKQIWLAVANGTGRAGATAKTVARLRKQGFNHVYITHREIDAAPLPLAHTQIIAQQGNPDAANVVKSALGIGQVQVAATGDIGSEVTVVVGNDLAASAK